MYTESVCVLMSMSSSLIYMPLFPSVHNLRVCSTEASAEGAEGAAEGFAAPEGFDASAAPQWTEAVPAAGWGEAAPVPTESWGAQATY